MLQDEDTLAEVGFERRAGLEGPVLRWVRVLLRALRERLHARQPALNLVFEDLAVKNASSQWRMHFSN